MPARGCRWHNPLVAEISSDVLLRTPTVVVRDVHCLGRCRDRSAEEASKVVHLAFPYRGVFVRHLGDDDAVAEANQVVLFNPGEGYRVSHPVAGGDDSLSLDIVEPVLRELAPRELLRDGPELAFKQQRLRIDPRTQVLVALLRHSLRSGAADTLEGESLALTLARRALGSRTTHVPATGGARRRLVDRVKLVLAADLARRWTLADIAAEVGQSPVYLTQAFQQVEGVPLYRYHLRLRLARALDLLAGYDDLTALGLDLGFSSHSHFTTAFSQAYGRTPSEFRGAVSAGPAPP
jgi:AraC family transcriptional regulator